MNYAKKENTAITSVLIYEQDLKQLKKHDINVSLLIRDLVRKFITSGKLEK